MALTRLTGDDATPQERVVILTSDTPRPVVEVIEESATAAVLHVVEPVLVDAAALQIALDDLTDVDAANPPTGVPLMLERLTDGTYAVIELPPIPPPPTSHEHWQVGAATLWQIVHTLGFKPAGVRATEYDSTIIEPDKITYPLPNVVELEFGVPVAGRAWLS